MQVCENIALYCSQRALRKQKQTKAIPTRFSVTKKGVVSNIEKLFNVLIVFFHAFNMP